MARLRVRWDVSAAVIAAVFGVLMVARAWTIAPPTPLPVAAPQQVVAPPPAPPDPPPAEPSQNTPTLVEAANANVDVRAKALARELSAMWTSNPDELVNVIQDASRAAKVSPSVTLLLAIAHAETNGKVLDVSEAGAVGLAQATPIACRQEHVEGKLFVTADYLTGARAYIMKKPLGDADRIATLVLDHRNAFRRARRLLKSAHALRREGVDDLDLLDIWAGDAFYAAVRKADRHNIATLDELGRLLRQKNRRELRAFRNRVRREYRALLDRQRSAWNDYLYDLAQRRDVLLAEHFHQPPAAIKDEKPYQAGELLAESLDVRFSPTRMAAFLVAHLERKSEEAQKLARSDRDVEKMTAALYNGGSHNVKRMLAGLIASLPETERYMRKVPATRRRLDSVVASR